MKYTIETLIFCHFREQVESLRQTTDALQGELKGSTDVYTRQEELIATLKEENDIISDMEGEMKEARRKYTELKLRNDEQSVTISTLRKVRLFLSSFIDITYYQSLFQRLQLWSVRCIHTNRLVNKQNMLKRQDISF